MTQPSAPAEILVVGTDVELAKRLRRRSRRILRVGATVSVVLAALVVAGGLVLTFALDAGIGGVGFVVAGCLLLWTSWSQISRLRRDRAWFNGDGLTEEAFRISSEGLRLTVEGADRPVVLPWPAVRSVATARWLGQQILIVLPGDSAADEVCVEGLEQPAVRRALSTKVPGGLYYSVRCLTVPLDDVAAAVSGYSAGTVQVTQRRL